MSDEEKKTGEETKQSEPEVESEPKPESKPRNKKPQIQLFPPDLIPGTNEPVEVK